MTVVSIVLFTIAVMVLLASPAMSFGVTSSSLRSRPQLNNIQMKIFDWKERAEFSTYNIPEDYVLSVTTLAPIPGSRKKFNRVGRGISAGQGKTCGRGMRGQKSRSGEGKGVRAGFEGGQTALYRRLPKFVGSPMKGHTKTEFALIKLDMLNEFGKEGAEVKPEALVESGVLTHQSSDLFKVVGGSELSIKGLTVYAHAFTESAREAIEGSNGKCILISRTTNAPIDA